MFRTNWLMGAGLACVVMSIYQPAAMADESVTVTTVSQYQATPTPMVIPSQQPYCYQRPRCGAGHYSWNGSWGPGCYLAVPRLHFHRTRTIRPE